MNHPKLSQTLLDWYSQNARDLPWRRDSGPYAVWISEIMLQQTRVETVIPYFNRWMERFPDVSSLAEASQQEVLAVWEGLGYYGRARNLHQAARIVMAEYNGALPADISRLSSLPGIGRYTSGAIASIAFGIDAPALDGNIRRVMARIFDVSEPARSPAGEKQLYKLVEAHLPPGKAGSYNQALMDLGAVVCTPRAPDCPKCPLRIYCKAFAGGFQAERPVRLPRVQVPHHTVTAAVICSNSQVLIAQRPTEGLLGGLWEFPGGKLELGESLENCLAREICEELQVEVEVADKLGVYQHAYTHFKVTVHAFFCSLRTAKTPLPIQVQDLTWVACSELDGFPMGKIDRMISRDLQAKGLPC